MGSERSGVVNLHMVKGPGYPDWDYRVFALDVPGNELYASESHDLQELSGVQVSLGYTSKAVMLLRRRKNRVLRC